MKRLLVFLCAILCIFGTLETAETAIVTVEFGFTVTYVKGLPLSVGDKGTGWFSYDDEIPGDIHDFPPGHHDTGYYQAIEMYIGTEDYEIYSGNASIIMYNDYEGTDEFQVGYQKVVGDEIDTRIDLSFVGPEDLWDSLPATLPVPDFDLFTDRSGSVWNYNWAQDGNVDKQVDFEYDYIRVVPEAPVCSSTVTTIPDLNTEVEALDTSPQTINALSKILDNAQKALDKDKNKKARNQMKNFIGKVVSKSNLKETSSHKIGAEEANNLICAAANVLIGIPLE